MKRAIALLLAVILIPRAADAQERAAADSLANTPYDFFALPRIFALPGGSFELSAGHEPSWLAPQWTQSPGTPLFTEEDLQKARIPDPNRSLRLLRTDVAYNRMLGYSAGPDGTNPSPALGLLNQVLGAVYVYARERELAKNNSPVDYAQLPLNTGMYRTFEDFRDIALRRGDAQAGDVLGTIRIGLWPYGDGTSVPLRNRWWLRMRDDPWEN